MICFCLFIWPASVWRARFLCSFLCAPPLSSATISNGRPLRPIALAPDNFSQILPALLASAPNTKPNMEQNMELNMKPPKLRLRSLRLLLFPPPKRVQFSPGKTSAASCQSHLGASSLASTFSLPEYRWPKTKLKLNTQTNRSFSFSMPNNHARKCPKIGNNDGPTTHRQKIGEHGNDAEKKRRPHENGNGNGNAPCRSCA